MKTSTLILFLFFTISLYSQSPILTFDGINDYVDLGVEAAENARTIELWFNLAEAVDINLENEKMIIGTEIPFPNINEWHLSLTKSGTVNPPGTLRFVMVTDVGEVSQVYSDANSWSADQWYHVAIVIDKNQGMIMFVDGFRQKVVADSYFDEIESNGVSVEVGRQNTFSERHFQGSIDDLRISDEALYLEDFTPPCPDLIANSKTIGLWNFNENEGPIANDASEHENHGEIYGATWDMALICKVSNHTETLQEIISFNVYPIPSDGLFTFESNMAIDNARILVYSDIGELLKQEVFNKELVQLDLRDKPSGIYYYKIIAGSVELSSGKLLKL